MIEPPGRGLYVTLRDRMADYFVHESAVVDEPCSIGEGTKIWHFSHIMRGSTVGRNCILGQNVYVDADVIVGDGCKLQNNVSVYKGVTIEDGVFCGPSMVFTNVINPRAFIERKEEFKPTLVQRGASLGANCTIVCGVTIGAYALIGAGSVVTRDVVPHGVVYGVPAQRRGWACKCGVLLPAITGDSAVACSDCGSRYAMQSGTLTLESDSSGAGQRTR